MFHRTHSNEIDISRASLLCNVGEKQFALSTVIIMQNDSLDTFSDILSIANSFAKQFRASAGSHCHCGGGKGMCVWDEIVNDNSAEISVLSTTIALPTSRTYLFMHIEVIRYYIFQIMKFDAQLITNRPKT